MLVLTMELQGDDNVIYVGNDITIKLVSVRGNRARVGFEVPRDIPVNRGSVHKRIQQELAEANKST